MQAGFKPAIFDGSYRLLCVMSFSNIVRVEWYAWGLQSSINCFIAEFL
jgi:hypothetical protein